MKGLTGKLLALLLALTLLAGSLTAVVAEDWRSLLRDLYGVTEEDENTVEETPEAAGETEDDVKEPKFELPVTDPQQIVNYLDIYGELPENFITKKEAMALGWDKSYNYVGEVGPGKSIGGDRFGNYEGNLPKKKGRVWYECDANYKGKARGSERVIFSSDGLYYYTNDHYQTFTEMFPEEWQ